jgi:hypothetical protein
MWAADQAGEARSEFIERAIQERAERLMTGSPPEDWQPERRPGGRRPKPKPTVAELAEAHFTW